MSQKFRHKLFFLFPKDNQEKQNVILNCKLERYHPPVLKITEEQIEAAP